jgi:uncharacterized membrane protein YfcA
MGFALDCLCALLIGGDKGGVPGLGGIAMTLVLSVDSERSVGQTLAVFAVVLMLSDLGAVYLYRNDINTDILLQIVPTMFVGMGVGFLLLGNLREDVIKFYTGIALLFLSGTYFVAQAFCPNRTGSHHATALPTNLDDVDNDDNQKIRKPQPAAGLPLRMLLRIWGKIAASLTIGLLTVVANVAGPLVAVYFMGLHFPKRELNGTRAFLFVLANAFKIPVQMYMGNLGLSDSMDLLPLVIVGMGATVITERFIMPHIKQQAFERIAWGLVLVGAVKLMIQ